MKECSICGKPVTTKGNRCSGCTTKIRRHRAKAAAIAMLGGKCNRCGWSGHQSAFEFHHKNPSEKEFSVGRIINKSWKIIEQELLKCELLCANCHSVEHSDRDNEKFLEAVYDYQGEKLPYLPSSPKKRPSLKNNHVICYNCKKTFQRTHFAQKFCCTECYGLYSRKVDRPTKNQLKKEIKENTWVNIGKKYGVSDNAVRRWAKNYGLI
jgi:protein-arginine kinase activator protein McsA